MEFAYVEMPGGGAGSAVYLDTAPTAAGGTAAAAGGADDAYAEMPGGSGSGSGSDSGSELGSHHFQMSSSDDTYVERAQGLTAVGN